MQSNDIKELAFDMEPEERKAFLEQNGVEEPEPMPEPEPLEDGCCWNCGREIPMFTPTGYSSKGLCRRCAYEVYD